MSEPIVPDPWIPAPGDPVLAADEVHVWRLRLSVDAMPDDVSMLSDDERAKADRFHFHRDRNRYQTCRATLRRVLGAYLRAPATAIRIEYGAQGKPRLAEPGLGIRFNVSHSPHHALIAVARDHEVGVDVEELREELDPLELALQFFAPAELRFVEAHPPDQHRVAFLRCWTRKEALLKALGAGLSKDPQRLDVSATLGREGGFLTDPDNGSSVWRVFELRPHEDAVAALVTHPSIRRLRLWAC